MNCAPRFNRRTACTKSLKRYASPQLLVGGLAVLLSSTGTSLGQGQVPIKTSIAVSPASFSEYPVYLAEALGLFRNTDSTSTSFTQTARRLRTALEGSVDFAGQSMEQTILVDSAGHDTKMFVLTQTSSPFTLIVRNSVRLPNQSKGYPAVMADLKGLKLGVTSHGGGRDHALRWFKDAGMNPDEDVSIVPVGGVGPAIAALTSGQVDGTMAFEPIQTQAIAVIKCCKAVVDLEGGQGPKEFADYAFLGVAARGDFLRTHSEVARRMVASIVDAQHFINNPKNLDANVAIAGKYMKGISSEVLRSYLHNYRQVFAPSRRGAGLPTLPKSWQTAAS